MKGCLQWQQMLCVQWPHGDSLECAQHFTRHRPTYWPKHIDQMPRRTKGAREHSDLWDRLFTEQGIYGHWENLQITVVFVHIVLMICQREREGSDQPIEADMELMWGQYGSITSNRGELLISVIILLPPMQSPFVFIQLGRRLCLLLAHSAGRRI